jgi:uncharacterized membrane protein (UPF0127 family)
MRSGRTHGDISIMRPPEPKMIVNLTRESVVCEQATIADRAVTRMRGLLGRRALPSGEGLLLRPAPSVHTAFMRFPIDVVFLDGDLRVLKFVRRLQPWRAASALSAKAVLELAAGESARRELGLADRLAVVQSPHAPPVSELSPADDVAITAYGRVLLVANDRRFRAVASTLLTQRGYSVAIGDHSQDVTEFAAREGAEVVVIDATASLTSVARDVARLEALRPRVGVVVVSAEPRDGLIALPLISKWNSFEVLFEAIEQALSDTQPSRVTSGYR